jgi:hypothetical protein
MGLLQEQVSLDADEKIIDFFRPHIFFMIAWGIPLAFAMVVLFLFLFKLLGLGTSGALLFMALFILFGFLLSSRILSWYGTVSVLTNRRLLSIRRHSLLRKQVHEVVLQNISELSYTTKGVIQTLFRFGNVHLTISATNTKFTLYNIPYPQQAMDVISAAVAKRRSSV